MSDPSVPSRFRPGSLVPELVAISCFLALLWIGIALGLSHEYRSAEAAALQNAGNLAHALDESTRRTIGQIDSILLSGRAMRAAKGDHFDFEDWRRTQTFVDKTTAQMATADAAGLVTASTSPFVKGLSIADRAHFRGHLDPAHDDLFISHPVTGRASGKGTIQFSRKMLTPEGEFAGVIVVSLGCEELSRFYELL